MRQPPPLSRFVHYPITAGTGLLAIGVTALAWSGRSVDPMYMNVLAFEGEPWRLVSSTLPHGSVVHLVFNVIWLWIFGTAIETVWGAARTLAIFLLLAVGTSLAEYALFDGGIGLSGIGYGLFGLLAVLSRRDPRFAGAVDERTVRLFVGWFFLCIALTVANVLRIGNVAHGVGGVMGSLLGLALSERRVAMRVASGAAIAVLVGASAAGATVLRPRVNLSATGGTDSAYLGYTLLHAKSYAEAIHHLRRAVEIDPDDAGSWFNLGSCLAHTDDLAGARAAYRRAYELEPKDAQYRAGVVDIAIDAGIARANANDSRGAIAFYQEALALDAGNSTALYDLSLAHANLGEWSAALDAARKAYAADKSPSHATRLAGALENAGADAEQRSDEARAIELYQEAVGVAATSSLYYRLASAYTRLGRTAEADDAMAKARALDTTETK